MSCCRCTPRLPLSSPRLEEPMRSVLFTAALFSLTAALPSVLNAQFAADQIQSLKGIRTISVNMAEPNQEMDVALRDEMFEAAILELRKSGLRVVRDQNETQSTDALLNLSVFINDG